MDTPGPASVDEELFRRLSGWNDSAREGLMIPFCTIDDEGWPHASVVSYSELRARTGTSFDLALHEGTAAVRNLRRTGRCTMLLFDADRAIYVKAAAREYPAAAFGLPGYCAFALRAHAIKSDRPDPRREAGVRIMSGPTFESSRAFTATRGEVYAALTRLAATEHQA